MYYKVIIRKICFVEAESIEDAKEKALDEDFIQATENVVSVLRTTKSKAMDLYSDMED